MRNWRFEEIERGKQTISGENCSSHHSADLVSDESPELSEEKSLRRSRTLTKGLCWRKLKKVNSANSRTARRRQRNELKHVGSGDDCTGEDRLVERIEGKVSKI